MIRCNWFKIKSPQGLAQIHFQPRLCSEFLSQFPTALTLGFEFDSMICLNFFYITIFLLQVLCCPSLSFCLASVLSCFNTQLWWHLCRRVFSVHHPPASPGLGRVSFPSALVLTLTVPTRVCLFCVHVRVFISHCVQLTALLLQGYLS